MKCPQPAAGYLVDAGSVMPITVNAVVQCGLGEALKGSSWWTLGIRHGIVIHIELDVHKQGRPLSEVGGGAPLVVLGNDALLVGRGGKGDCS
jgi:hypothetical protein